MPFEPSPPSLDALASYLAGAPAPVAVKKLTKDLRTTAEALEEAARSGRVYLWPKFRGAIRYWHSETAGTVRQQVLALIAARAMAKADLVRATVKKAYNCGTKTAEAAVASLVREGLLTSAKTVGPTALYYDPKHPQALVDSSLAIVRERLRKLNIEAAAPDSKVPPTAETGLADRVLDSVARLQPAPMVPVTVQSLRAAFPGVPKTEFDSCVLSLADGQRIYLTTHDHGWALPETERDQLVWDGGNKLYVAVTLRD